MTPTLTDFLLAQIAEDEARVDQVPEWHCTDSGRGEGWGSRGECRLCGAYMFDGAEDVTEQAMWQHLEDVHRRSRVLAECEAKRRIVERAAEDIAKADAKDSDQITRSFDAGAAFFARNALLALALPYADHPDYDEAWRS